MVAVRAGEGWACCICGFENAAGFLGGIWRDIAAVSYFLGGGDFLSWELTMNCKNCGAPMKAVDGQRHFFCEYCDTQVVAPEVAGSADGLKPSSEASGLCCPSCPAGNELFHGLLDDQKVEFCPECLGVWLETEDFAALVRDRRMAYAGPDDQPSPVNQDALKRRRECPGCHAPMEVHPYYGPGNVVLDSCGKCKRIWLEQGELTSIVRAAGFRDKRQHASAKRDKFKSDKKSEQGKYAWQEATLFEKMFDDR